MSMEAGLDECGASRTATFLASRDRNVRGRRSVNTTLVAMTQKTTEVAEPMGQRDLHTFVEINDLADEETVLHDAQKSLPLTPGGMELKRLAWICVALWMQCASQVAGVGRAPTNEAMTRRKTRLSAGGPCGCGEAASGNGHGSERVDGHRKLHLSCRRKLQKAIAKRLAITLSERWRCQADERL